EHGVDPFEGATAAQATGSAHDTGFVATARLAYGAEATQPIGAHVAARGEMGLTPARDLAQTKAAHPVQPQPLRVTLLVGGHCGHHGGLASGAATALAATPPAPEGVIELDQSGQRLGRLA